MPDCPDLLTGETPPSSLRADTSPNEGRQEGAPPPKSEGKACLPFSGEVVPKEPEGFLTRENPSVIAAR